MWAKNIIKSSLLTTNLITSAFSTNANPSVDRTPKNTFMKIVNSLLN